MQTLTPMFGSGVKYSLPADKVDSFKQDFGDQAEDGVSFRTNDGKSYTIPLSKVDAFKADFPESEEVRTFKMANGTKKQMTVPEVSKFIRSKEYRESQDFADERKRIEASLPEPTVKEDGRTFSDELSASGGGAVGKNVGSVISGLFSAFGQQLRNAAVASPLGMPGQTIHGGDPKKVQATMHNNAADRAGNVVREWTDILFPDVEASNGFQEANKKAVEFGTGLAKFGIMASNPLSLASLVAESYGNAATETFDTGIRNGMSVEDASGLANIRGLVDGGITAAFAGAPVKRLAGALGLKTPEVVAPKVASVIKNGIGAAKNSLSAGIAKAMAVEAGKAAIEMGSLSFAQGMFDNAVMQEAEHPDKPIDWMAAAKAGGIDGLEQATVGAVLGLLPTPVRISRARRGLEKGMRDALATPEGVEAYYSQNREGAAGLIKAFNKNGKISRTDAREAGLPEMSEVERNELAKNLTEKLKEEVAPAVEKQKVAEERRAAEAKMAAEGHKAASIRGMEERAKRKAEMAEYEKAEAERKAREAAEEAGALEVGQEAAIEEEKQTNARASVEAETNAAPKSRTEEYPEYATWLKHKFRTDTDKNWNKFVAENGLDPALKVERGREAKHEEAQHVAEAPKTPVEASVEEAVKPIDQTAPKAVEGTEEAKLQTPAEIRDTMKDDAVLKRIDAAYKKAKTDAERNALAEQFKARVDELRKEQAKIDTETQKLTQEVSKNDGVEVKTDNEISPITGKPYKSDSPWIGEQGGGMNFDKAHADEAVEQMNRQAEEMKMPVRFEKDPTGRVVVSHNPHYGYGSEYQMAESVFNALMNGKRLAVGAFKPNNTASTSTSAPKPDGKGKMVSPKTIATKAEEVSQTTEVTKKPDGKGRMVKEEAASQTPIIATTSAAKKVLGKGKSGYSLEGTKESFENAVDSVRGEIESLKDDGKSVDFVTKDGKYHISITKGKVLDHETNKYVPAWHLDYTDRRNGFGGGGHAESDISEAIRWIKSAGAKVIDPNSTKTPPSASAPKKVEPPSKSSLVKMKVENVIALPDGIEKYRELRARAGLRYGHTRNSGSGQMAAREYERMDKDGWGDMWNAQMSWAMADKKTRGEPPPDNLEEFKKWKSEREGIAPKKVESTAPTAKKSAESVKGRPSNLSAMTENANSSTLAVIKGRSEKGVFPDEVIIMPNGHGVKQQGRESEKSPCVLFRYKTDGKDTVGHPLYGDVDAITKWAEENGMSVTRQIAKSEEPVQRVPDGKGEVGQDLLDLGGAEGEDLFNRVNKQTDSVSSDSLKTAKKLLKEKFYADEKTLMREMKALPSQANELRVAYETAISEAKKRNATPNDVTSDTSNGGAYRGNLDQIADRTSMHRLDPKKRSEPAVLAWAKKRGRVVDNGMVSVDARREYDREQAMGAAKLSRNWFPDMKVTYHNYGENVKRGQHVLDLRDRSGNTLGWFDPNSKEVHLLPGANAETVAHEIMWHGTRDWANTEAAKGNTEATRLLNKMHEVENACPASLKKAILRAYRKTGVTDPDTLLNEFGAWDAMVNGGNALGKELQKRENAVWYARWWNAAKDLIKSYLARHGKNRVDFTDIDGMTTDEFKDFLAEQFAGGKTLGEIVPKAGKTVSTDETKLQKARRIIYDVNAPIRDLERDIEKAHGVKIKFEESAEAANALTPGLREAELLATSASEREYREILDAGKLSNADVEAYMGAKAAAGRDAKVDAKNLAQIAKDVERDLRAEWGMDKIAKDTAAFDAELQNRVSSAQAAYNSTNGSHIDPREARMTVSETETGSHAADYANARKKLRAVMDETLKVQKDAGLISEELYNKLKTEEPDYVPFKNEYDVETGEAYGRGVNNFTKPEFYEARGRQSAAGDIVTHIFQDNLAAKHRAIENGVREKLARLVERFPELGTVEKVGEAWKEKQKDTSDWFDKSNKHGEHNVVMFKRNGDTYAIRLNGTRGAAIAAGITERNVMRFSGKIGEGFNKFSRFQAGLATRYAPFFAFRNLPKDNIELGNIVLRERGLLEGSRWIKDYVASYKDTAGALSKFVLTGKVDASTTGGQVLQRYIDAGGLISGGGTEGYDAHSIRTRMDPKLIEKEMKRGRSKTYATLQYAKRGLGYLSEMSELMTRVNAFNAELKAGKSDGEAALFSRRATVDFNRHGELTGVTNVLRLFSNSTLGAMSRATAALANSKGGRTMAAILFANGMARVALEHLMNDEDDNGREADGTGTGKDVPEYERQTSLFYVRNGKNLNKVAMHESPFSLITYAGDTLARVLYGDISVGQAAKNLGISTAEVAYGLTGLGSINLTSREGGLDNDLTAAAVSGIVPSIMQPIAEVWSGIDYKGDPISMQLFDTTDVRSHHPRANTPDYQVKTAQFLNRITGGNAGRRGYADLAPEAVGKLIEGYGKNALREGLMAYDLAKAMVGDKKWSDVDVGQKPLVRDWIRPIRGNTNRYYDAKRTRKEDRKDFDANSATMSVEERYAYATSHPSAVGRRSEAMSKMETSIQRLQKMERGFIYKNGKAVPHEWSDEKINELEKRRLELQAKYIKLMETQTNQ